ncbi:MAG: primosomal protein N' (replication factor Y) [Gallionellaceae bacterium]|nr:MAG: primosomal protein N' (replication factor Y) [Gallionellaceae bacterium]
MPIVRVALDVPLSTLFDYLVDADLSVDIGQRVLVPFGRKHVVGIVMEVAESSGLAVERIKSVVQVLDDVPPLPCELLTLLRFCSDYYHHPLGMTVMAALPARLRAQEPVAIKQELSYALTEQGHALDLTEFPKRRVVQLRLLQALQHAALGGEQIRALSPSAPANLKALIGAGWVEPSATTEAAPAAHVFNEAHTLTQAQRQAVDAVAKTQGFRCFLLHGITGSGKTEVYVHLMHQVLQRGGQVLLLVPEINLTPQLENYFRSRFPDAELASLHSGLNDGERARKWLRAQSGRARIVLGTRLAVFTPLPQLGLILVDEEHDSSFKQQDGLRYSARDVAIFRANQRGVPIVLGSATPSLESYYNAQSGRYQLLKLTQRAAEQAQLPQVRCINTNNMPLQEGISPAMLTALDERLQRKEQSLIFINRRGYAPVLMCTACGWLSGCSNCAGKLVLHLKDRRLRCHHCGHQERVPHACPGCGNTDLQPVGIGTQRVEEALQAYFPEARIMRVDRDSTRNKGSWIAMRKQIEDEAVDILVGTQILAKGHDFPSLTLVGVLNPDGALYSADFRASEKLFAQLAQVAGRAGRADKPGEVLVQTAFPDHPLFRALRAHDYGAWAQTLLAEREQAGFPPFVFQVLLRAEGKQEGEVYAFMKRAREAAMTLSMPVEIYGVVAAAMPKRANHIRAQLLVQSTTRKSLQQFLRSWHPLLEQFPAQRIRWSLDIDPLEF